MKKPFLTILLLLLVMSAFAQRPVVSQTATEDVEMRIPASEWAAGSRFHLKNINGDVNVTGYDGDEILITGKKKIWKKTGPAGDVKTDDIYLDKLIAGDNLYVFIQAPGVEVYTEDDDLHYHMHWKDRWRNDREDRLHFEFNLEIKIPETLFTEVSTINNGDVVAENMRNGIYAYNVNGGVYLKEISGKTKAHTVNGDIKVWFAESPKTDTRFNTVNGTIEIFSPKDFSAVVTFESLHGELYTDFDDIEYLPNRLNKISDRGGKRYKIERTAPVKIGNGGPEMSFELVNGSAYIRQRES